MKYRKLDFGYIFACNIYYMHLRFWNQIILRSIGFPVAISTKPLLTATLERNNSLRVSRVKAMLIQLM